MEQCLMPFNAQFHVLGFSETRLNDTIEVANKVSGYNGFYNSRNTRGGGLAVYLDLRFLGSYISDITLQCPHIETLSLLVSQPYNFVVCVI